MNSGRRLTRTLAAALLFAGCATTPAARRDDPQPRPNPTIAIPARLHASADAWNRGNLAGFLAPYLDAPETTFVGGSGLVHGLDQVRAGYESSYWSSGRPAQSLGFADITVRPLGPGHALAVGRYVLSDPATGDSEATGYFSLVWRHTAAYGWQIIHDHSSADSSP